jgi:hypothetical protein
MSDTPGKSGDRALARTDVASRLPAQELERAPAFYANKLGLQPVEERAGGLRYRSSTVVSLFASAGEQSGQHTQMAWRSTWRSTLASGAAAPGPPSPWPTPDVSPVVLR